MVRVDVADGNVPNPSQNGTGDTIMDDFQLAGNIWKSNSAGAVLFCVFFASGKYAASDCRSKQNGAYVEFNNRSEDLLRRQIAARPDEVTYRR